MPQQNEPNVQKSGMDALTSNVMNIWNISNIVGSTLGPQGIDVEIINNVGQSIVSNDGATILTNLAVNDPIVINLVECSNILAENVGDGTTTMTVLAGQLCYNGLILKQAEGLDPVTVTKGYKLAYKKVEELLNKYSMDLSGDTEELKRFVSTSLTGKNTEGLDSIYNICLEAVTQTNGELDNIRKIKIKNGSVSESELIKGIVLDVNVLHDNMPELISQPKILILDEAIELINMAVDMKLNISSSGDYKKMLNSERDQVLTKARKIHELDVNVVICQRNIQDYAIDYFARNNIIAVRNINIDDANLISQSTHSNIVKDLNSMVLEDLGTSDKAYIKKFNKERYVVLENKESNVVSIIIGGSNILSQDEYERGIDDALGVIKTILKFKKYVYGAGSIEIKLAYDLREYAKTIDNGKLQAAVEKYAESLEHIPKLLAESCGLNKLSALGKLRVNKDLNYGIDVINDKVDVMTSVIEPSEVKRSSYEIATNFACDTLRIGYILQGRVQ